MSSACNAVMEIGISLGSNLGDRLAALQGARRQVANLPGVQVRAVSPVYETEPVGVPHRYHALSFLNAVMVVATALAPGSFAVRLQALEVQMGRRRGPQRNAPRPIDLDLIYAGSLRMHTPVLCIPHPRWAMRRFVAVPLADIRPDLVLPGRRRTVRQIAAGLPRKPTVVLFRKRW
jgi:2-amino-4-hydroxy-6-hydroxymethyldihydropteridine diphosphokinase